MQRTQDGQYRQVTSASSAASKKDYTQIKNITHISVSLTMLIETIIAKKLALNNVINDLNILYSKLEQARIISKENKNHLNLIHYSMTFITKIKACADLTKIALLLNQYLEKTKSLNESCAKQAAVLQLTSIDKIMKEWTAQKEINLKKSRVIIVGPDGPREELIEKQYFDMLYTYADAKKTEYITMLPKQALSISIQDLISELGKRELNKTIGKRMLNDEHAMSKDVLTRYSRPILTTLFNKKPNVCPMKRLINETQYFITSMLKGNYSLSK